MGNDLKPNERGSEGIRKKKSDIECGRKINSIYNVGLSLMKLT